ncbi:MAG: OsmC family protein [Robiginitomaculum sp.]
MSKSITVSERRGDKGAGKYTNDVMTARHRLIADEPESLGSADLGPAPFEYICAGLGACTTITLRMYAGRKNWPALHLSVDVSYKVRGDQPVFTRVLTIEGDLDESQRARMVEIADKCPVHKMLTKGSLVETTLT